MKKNISILGSTLLAITLLSGCGSNSSDTTVKTSYIKIMESRNDSNNISSEDDIKSAIQDQIDTTRVEKVSLSPQKYGAAVLVEGEFGSDIYLYGLEDPKNPKREYKIMSSDSNFKVTNLSMKSNGILEYTLQNKDTSSNTVVTYNYFDKKEISRSSDDNNNNENSNSIQSRVEAAIRDQSENDYAWQLREVVLTPSKQGAIVEIATDQGSYLYLYGIENPDSPVREQLISMDDIGHAQYKDITMLGDGKIKYTTSNYNDSYRGDYITLTYDYFNKKFIGAGSGAGADSIQSRVESAIRDQHKDSYAWQLREVVLTPSKQGAIVEIATDQGSYLYLYGIENPDSPVREHFISMDDMGHAQYKDITMLGNGKIRYTTYNYNEQKDVTVTYDYFNKKTISTEHEGESLSKIEKRLNDSIENEKKNINKNPTGGLMNVSVKIYDKTSDGRLIASTTAVNGNAKHVYFGIFYEDDLKYHDILAINWDDSNILTNFYSSPGVESGKFSEYISLDKNTLTYKVRDYNSNEWVVKTHSID